MRYAFRSEAAFREEVAALILAVPLALWIGTTGARRIEMILAVVFVMTVELLNTAIEKLADRLTLDHDPQIGRVKDLGSAGVAGALLIAGGIWLFAIGERLGIL